MSKFQKMLELRRDRAELVEKAGEILAKAKAEGREMRGSEQAEFDRLHAKAKELKNRHDQVEAERANEMRVENLEPLDGAKARGGDAWVDREGREVRVLAPDDSVRKSLKPREGEGDFSSLRVGDYFRALVAGPRTDLERRALSGGTGSARGFTVPTLLAGGIIDLARAASVVMRAGGRTVPMTADNLSIARVASDPAGAWRAENAAVAESDPTFDQVTLQPYSLAVLVKASRELIADSPNIQTALERAIGGALAVALDSAALTGDGAGKPKGVSSFSGVNEKDMGTNGAAITDYDPFIDAILEVANDNHMAPDAAVMAPRTWATIAKFADTTGQPLRRPDALSSLRVLQTTSIPVNETHGSASNASRVIMGGFDKLIVGMRQEIVIEVLRERYADNLQFGFLAHLRADTALERAEAFTQITGIIP